MKYLLLFLGLAMGLVWGVSNIFPDAPGYTSVMGSFQGEPVQAQMVAVEPVFDRSNTRDSGIAWQKLPCRDSRTNSYYESEILSRDEVLFELKSVGFTGQMVEDMSAISLAESGRQISCVADENLTDATWDVSYGVWAIRAVKAQQGTGSCRDIERLRKDDFHDQTVCAFEISGEGKTFQPWSVTHLNRGRPYLKYLGK